jgi:hypothetical protein
MHYAGDPSATSTHYRCGVQVTASQRCRSRAGVRVEPGRVPRPAEPDRTRPSTPRRRGEFVWSQDGSRGRQSRTAPVHPRHDDVANSCGARTGPAAGRAGPHPSIHATTTWRIRVEPGRVPRPAEPDRTRPSTPRRRGEFVWSQDGSRGRQSRTASERVGTRRAELAHRAWSETQGVRMTRERSVLAKGSVPADHGMDSRARVRALSLATASLGTDFTLLASRV